MYISDSPTVLVKNLRKVYRSDNKRTVFRNPLESQDKKSSRYVHALKGITFIAEQGESIGVLGRNGSGKSTLMRLIASKEAPSSGEVLVSSTPTLRSEEHTSELQSRFDLVCRLLLEKKK